MWNTGTWDILKDEIGISTEKVVEKIERLLQHR